MKEKRWREGRKGQWRRNKRQKESVELRNTNLLLFEKDFWDYLGNRRARDDGKKIKNKK